MRPHGLPASYRTGGIDVVNLETGSVERLYETCNGNRLNGPNDLVFDGGGGFWFTDLGKRRARDMDRGFVYWAKADGSEIREVISAMQTPNGIGLSPDGKTLYVAETDTARLWAYEITGPGEIRRAPWPSPHGGWIVAGLPGYNRFDSLAVASSGAICVAGVESCSIFEIAPHGAVLREHTVPDLMVTNLAFGGPDLRTAYVTLSHSGRLLALDWPEPGLRLHYQ
jgi:gluconolactonase